MMPSDAVVAAADAHRAALLDEASRRRALARLAHQRRTTATAPARLLAAMARRAVVSVAGRVAARGARAFGATPSVPCPCPCDPSA